MTRTIALVSAAARLGREHLAPLETAGFRLLERYELDALQDAPRLAAGLRGAWAVVAGGERYDRAVFDAVPELRAVVRAGVGYDAVDVEAAATRGVAVCITPNANSDSVADHALTLMLAVLRRLDALQAAVRSGAFRADGLAGDLSGATVGIVGLGAIGRRVAERLRGFGCRLLGADPWPDGEACARLGLEVLPLAELLPQVDVLTLHAPLTPATRHLIGPAELARLRPGAIVVNTARGGLVDEAALLDALRAGRLAGAGLDVFEREPLPPDHPLLALEGVVATGHQASYTRATVARTLALVVEALLDLDAGRIPAGLLRAAPGTPVAAAAATGRPPPAAR